MSRISFDCFDYLPALTCSMVERGTLMAHDTNRMYVTQLPHCEIVIIRICAFGSENSHNLNGFMFSASDAL